MKGWRDRPGMCGLRFAFLRPGTTNWLTDGSMEWLWSEAEKHNIPIAMLVPGRAREVGEIAGRFPGLKLIVDHCAARRGGLVDGEAFADIDSFVALAKAHPNVALKATGAPSYSSQAYPFKPVHDPLHRMFDAFGPERFFWGTDITRMPCSWRQCVTLFTEELPWLKGRDLELVMGEAMRRWIGWNG
jgi:predicted TIM-barrel fold metal-dependent hydrolase